MIARVFAASENEVQPVKTALEIESDLTTDYKNKLKINDFPILDRFKIPHGWMRQDKGMAFWPMLSFSDMFNFFMFYSSELGRKDLSDYKNNKVYSYYKSGWLQHLQYHNLSGSIIRGKCRKSRSIKDSFHNFWIIFEKVTKIRTCHCTCMAVMGETCNHVAAAMYRVEATVRIGLTNPACTSNANEWLPDRKTIEPKIIKDLDFGLEDFPQRGKKETISSFTKKEV